MNQEERGLVREALRQQLRKETLERALGRVLRKTDRGFESYIAIMSEIRETAGKKKVSVEEAAAILVNEGTAEASERR
jgi:hypothetical protein